MEYNVNWRVYVEGEDNTYPRNNENNLIHVYNSKQGSHHFCYFYNNTFHNRDGKPIRYKTPVFWQYVGILPNVVKKSVVTMCNVVGSTCEFSDNGYCFDKPEGMNCPYCIRKIEYHAYND